MEIKVREANLSDLDNLLEMLRDLGIDQLGKDYFYKGSLDFDIDENCIKNSITSKKCGLFVAEYCGNVQGFIEMYIDNNNFKFEHNNYAYLANLYVKPESRNNNGIYSSTLYKAAENWAVSKERDFVIADTFAHNEKATRIFKRFGLSKYKTLMVREI
ncbi:GNAT family N-acetyltransferase [Paraclostridium ghonii]|uniref:Ribosomal protein S18 acetylase RimI-like enzyme n=1 Tax=Paraclostridium ghonii TaxID=29358 RepID=A0ABU0N479_9FIRM|nr:GNAT family N-acetyltransferase [Paeniclostridium ghonii]MDQ0557968.1 ribosomal protein S18 acetylase RimI-like enzyme [Paeniclostridium ghonii]